MPGAERGAAYAVAAADNAESAAAWDEAAGYLRVALELMRDDDPGRAAIAGRLALSLIWALQEDEAVEAARQAIGIFERTSGAYEAGVFASQIAHAAFGAGFAAAAWALASRALELLGEARDVNWARARAVDLLRREAEDPENPGMPILSPERLELLDVLDTLNRFEDEAAAVIYGITVSILPRFRSRVEAMSGMARFLRGDAPGDASTIFFSAFHIGDYDAGEEFNATLGENAEESGLLATAVAGWSQVARMQLCRGELVDARRTLNHVEEIVPRLTRESLQLLQYSGALDEEWCAIGDRYDTLLARFSNLATNAASENRWAMAAVMGALGRGMAADGAVDPPLAFLAQIMPSVERADAATANYVRVVCHAAEILWHTQRADFADVIERNIREKVIATDFRYPMVDGRRSMAHICAVTGRYDEAAQWFEAARSVLDEQGARPMRALVDYDEAVMYARRGLDSDPARALELIDTAMRQFREIGMTGWEARAEQLRDTLTAS